MRLSVEECRRRLASSRVARLATSGADRRPHLVPVTFAVAGDRLVFAVDQKPKGSTRLRRLRNIAENPRVAVLADHYDDDWTKLWWVRADGEASVIHGGEAWAEAVDMLIAKYRQYADDPPGGPSVVIDIDAWSGWAHGG